jgi:YHS domain-containing protein
MAVAPVTGEQVDKAQAIMVQDSAGKVMYFDREETLRRYRS